MKRFNNKETDSQIKSRIIFPIKDFDLRHYAIDVMDKNSPSIIYQRPDLENSLMYDLYAVCYHNGQSRYTGQFKGNRIKVTNFLFNFFLKTTIKIEFSSCMQKF